MMRKTLIVVIVVATLAFLFIVPVVYVQPQGFLLCPIHGCDFYSVPRYGSVTYSTFNLGGVWTDGGYYTVIL